MCLAIGLEQEEGILIVKRLTSDVGVHCAGSRLVLESDVDGSHAAIGSREAGKE